MDLNRRHRTTSLPAGGPQKKNLFLILMFFVCLTRFPTLLYVPVPGVYYTTWCIAWLSTLCVVFRVYVRLLGDSM